MHPQQTGRIALNVLSTAGAALLYVFLVAWVMSFRLVGTGSQVTGVLRLYIEPLFIECMAAVIAGVALGYLLRTSRPLAFGLLLGGLLVMYRCAMTTVFWSNLRWQDAAWLLLDVLLPALVAAAATLWLYQRRRATLPTQA